MIELIERAGRYQEVKPDSTAVSPVPHRQSDLRESVQALVPGTACVAPARSRTASTTAKSSALFLGAMAGVALLVGTALGQPRLIETQRVRPGRELQGQPVSNDAPIPPRQVAPDATSERVRAFHGQIAGMTESTQRRMRLEQARRIAPFNLDWGLR